MLRSVGHGSAMTPFEQQLLIEGIRATVAFLILVTTWLFGQPILGKWELRKKRRELDFALSSEFQRLFGEYKEIWRLWKAHYESCQLPHQRPIEMDDSARWDLFRRSAAAEGRVEAIFVKLATDRPLIHSDLQRLGLFRQAYQVLRQGIRDGQPLDYSHDDPPYELFNVLACSVAQIINSDVDARPPQADIAQLNLATIQSYRGKDWRKAVTAWRDGQQLPLYGSSTIRIMSATSAPVTVKQAAG
jgi:hypothetical protein